MSEKGGEFQKILEYKRFLNEVEQAIQFANREIINKRIPNLCKDDILTFAVSVGRLRAHYLEAAFKLAVNESGEPPNDDTIDELSHRRTMYEEARKAFDALNYAIERGYVDLEGLTKK